MALTPFDMEGVNRDLLAAGNPAKPDMQSILRRNARDLVLGNAILVSSVDAKELEFGVHMAYSDADGGFDTDPSEDVWFEASSLPIPNERPDLPPDNALRIRVTDVLTEYGFTDIDVKAPDRTPEGIWIGFEAMQPVRLDVTSAQEGRSVSFTLTAAEANDWRSGRLDAHGLSRMAVERVLARPGDTVTLAYGDSLFRPAVMCDGSGRLPEHRVKAGIGTFVIGRESEAVMPEILRIDRTVDPRDPLVIEKAFGKENDMENGNVPEYWKGLMDEADLPLAGIVREHGGGLMDFHRMKGIERLTGSSDWDFYSWTVENYDDDLLDVCERENAADVLADLQAWWKTSQPDMRQHVDEMMAGIDAAMEPLDKRLYAAAEKEFKERALDPDGGMLPIGRRHVHLPGIIRRHLRRPTRPLHGMEEPGRTRQTRERMGRPRTPGPARGRPDRRGRWRRMLLHRRAAHRLHAGHGLQPTAAGRRQRAGRYGPAGV